MTTKLAEITWIILVIFHFFAFVVLLYCWCVEVAVVEITETPLSRRTRPPRQVILLLATHVTQVHPRPLARVRTTTVRHWKERVTLFICSFELWKAIFGVTSYLQPLGSCLTKHLPPALVRHLPPKFFVSRCAHESLLQSWQVSRDVISKMAKKI